MTPLYGQKTELEEQITTVLRHCQENNITIRIRQQNPLCRTHHLGRRHPPRQRKVQSPTRVPTTTRREGTLILPRPCCAIRNICARHSLPHQQPPTAIFSSISTEAYGRQSNLVTKTPPANMAVPKMNRFTRFNSIEFSPRIKLISGIFRVVVQ